MRLQQSPAGRWHCSHAYHDEAHVTKFYLGDVGFVMVGVATVPLPVGRSL